MEETLGESGLVGTHCWPCGGGGEVVVGEGQYCQVEDQAGSVMVDDGERKRGRGVFRFD